MIQDFIAFDFEMPTQEEPAISAVGISVVKNGKITERVYSLINPETEFSPYVVRLIGITPQMVKNKPTLPEFWEKIRKYFESGFLLVAHGIHGDLLTLLLALKKYGISFDKEISYLCTCDLTLAESPELEHHTLDYICDSLDIHLNHHDAQSDSDGCALVLLEYMKRGVDVEKYIKTEETSNLIRKHKARAFAKVLKSVMYKKRQANGAGNGPCEIEQKLVPMIEKLPRNKIPSYIKSSVVSKNCAFIGVNDSVLKRFAKNLDVLDVDLLLSEEKFFTYELFRIYVYCFNRCGYDPKQLLRLIYYLPSYYALEELDAYAVGDVVKADYEIDICDFVEELPKKNVYGFQCLCLYTIIERELWKNNTETILNSLESVNKSKFHEDKVIIEKTAEILSYIITAGGYDSRILNMTFSRRYIVLAVKKAIELKPSKENEIRETFYRYI